MDKAHRRVHTLTGHLVASQATTTSELGVAAATGSLNGGGWLVHQLAAEGCRLVTGVPGAGQYEATDALYNHDTVRYVATRHEQAATYIADAFSRVTDQVGCALIVPGPGFYNAASGLLSADSVHVRTQATHHILISRVFS